MPTSAFPDHPFPDPRFFLSEAPHDSHYRFMMQPTLRSPTATSHAAPIYHPSFGTRQQQSLAAPYTQSGQRQTLFARPSVHNSGFNYNTFNPFILTDAMDQSSYQQYIHRPLPEPNDIPGTMSMCHHNSSPRPQSHAHPRHIHIDEFLTAPRPHCGPQDNVALSNRPFGQGVQHLGQAAPQVEHSQSRARPRSPVQAMNRCSRSRPASLEFVLWNPCSPRVIPSKRVRSEEEVERQKRGCRELKEIGGACLWCYRVKKKCGTESPCSRCKTNEWVCIRAYTDLSLHITPGNNSPGQIPTSATDLFFEQAKTIFARLGESIAEMSENMQMIITLRQPRTEHSEYWVASIPEISMAQLNAPGNLHKQQLVSKALKHIHHPKLDSLAKEYSSYELVQSAVHLFQLTTAIRCFVRTDIYVHSNHIDHGRLTVIYMLITYMQALCEKSQAFCSQLWDHLHVKEPKGKGNCVKSDPPWKTSFNPVWVAAAVYLRVVCGLLDLKTSPPMSEAFATLEPHLMNIRQALTYIRDRVPVKHCSKSKQAMAAFKNDIPVVTEFNYFDVAFWKNRENETRLTLTFNRQNLLHSVDPYDMASFMDGRFKDADFIPGVSHSAKVPLETTGPSPESAHGTSEAIREIPKSERAKAEDAISTAPETSASHSRTLSTEVDTSNTEMGTMGSDIQYHYFHEGIWYLEHNQDSTVDETDEFWLNFTAENLHGYIY